MARAPRTGNTDATAFMLQAIADMPAEMARQAMRSVKVNEICAAALKRLAHPLYIAVDYGRGQSLDMSPGSIQFCGRKGRSIWYDEAGDVEGDPMPDHSDMMNDIMADLSWEKADGPLEYQPGEGLPDLDFGRSPAMNALDAARRATDEIVDALYRDRPPTVLEEAQKVYEDRHEHFPDAEAQYAKIAAMWSAWTGTNISSSDVIHMLIQMKQVRDDMAGGHRDSRVDIAGYANLQDIIDPKDRPE
jgi:hypothetical protein